MGAGAPEGLGVGPAPRGSRRRAPRLLFPRAADPPPGSAARRWAIGGWGCEPLPSLHWPAFLGVPEAAPWDPAAGHGLLSTPLLCEKSREMAEVGSREQFGALLKVLQPAGCLPEAGAPHLWSCSTPPLLPCELWGERPPRDRRRSAPWEGIERLSLPAVYTGDGRGAEGPG